MAVACGCRREARLLLLLLSLLLQEGWWGSVTDEWGSQAVSL